jgi:glyoxylase-like metal-dependent hydrolase (beta-lactamase superfamily II)
VKAIFTPGHTYGTQGVLVEGENRAFIPSDTIPLFENLETDPYVISNICDDPGMFRESMQKIKDLSALILPNHDPGIFEREVY